VDKSPKLIPFDLSTFQQHKINIIKLYKNQKAQFIEYSQILVLTSQKEFSTSLFLLFTI